MTTKTFLSLGEQIYYTLKERILTNHYTPGTLLQIEKLAEEMGVSSTPIRETLFKLDNVGLVNIIRNKGALVTDIDEKAASDIWRFRSLLERHIACEAAERLDTKKLHLIKEKIEYLAERSDDPELLWDTEIQLHAMFCDHAENYVMKGVLGNLQDHSRRISHFVRQNPAIEETLREISQEHLAIIDALLEKDARAVSSTIEEHMVNSEKRTLGVLSDKTAKKPENRRKRRGSNAASR